MVISVFLSDPKVTKLAKQLKGKYLEDWLNTKIQFSLDLDLFFGEKSHNAQSWRKYLQTPYLVCFTLSKIGMKTKIMSNYVLDDLKSSNC